MSLPELEPDADPALRIDLQLAVLLDVAELTGRCIIENEDDRGQTARKVDPAVQKLRDGDRSIAFLVDEFQIAPEVIAITRVQRVVIGYQVVLDYRNLSQLIRNPRGVRSRSD